MRRARRVLRERVCVCRVCVCVCGMCVSRRPTHVVPTGVITFFVFNDESLIIHSHFNPAHEHLKKKSVSAEAPLSRPPETFFFFEHLLGGGAREELELIRLEEREALLFAQKSPSIHHIWQRHLLQKLHSYLARSASGVSDCTFVLVKQVVSHLAASSAPAAPQLSYLHTHTQTYNTHTYIHSREL